MRTSENDQSILGHFWLPKAGEQTAIPGIMTFGEEGATVRLHDAITPSGLLSDGTVFARLQGRHAKATLTNCFAHATRNAEGVIVASRIDSTHVALGSMREDVGGHSVQFRLHGAHIWFNELCFESDDSGGPDITIRFKSEESFTYSLPYGLRLERFYSTTMPLGGWGQEQLGILRPMEFRISGPIRMEMSVLWDHLHRLRRFVEFVSQNQLPHADFRVYDDAELGVGRPDVEIRHSRINKLKPRQFEWDTQLVKFDEIESRFPALLHRWFEVHRDHPEPFSRYFAAFDRDRADPVLHFLWNVAAVEELHKLRSTRSKREFCLLDRLKAVRTKWASATHTQVPDAVLQEIATTRNYYAHAAGDLRGRAATDWKLLRYGDCMAALASLEMLSLLGLTDEAVVSSTRHYWLRETLALRKYPTE